jgi:hypothetical protein
MTADFTAEIVQARLVVTCFEKLNRDWIHSLWNTSQQAESSGRVCLHCEERLTKLKSRTWKNGQ